MEIKKRRVIVDSGCPLLIVSADEHDFHQFLFKSKLRLNEVKRIVKLGDVNKYPGETIMFTPESQLRSEHQFLKNACRQHQINAIDLEYRKK